MSSNSKPRRKSPETDLQIAIVQWFNLAYPDHKRWLHHSPNGGKRSISEAVRFKKMGVKAGFPDLVLYVRKYELSGTQLASGMAMELKASEKDKPTKEQEDWAEHLTRIGFYVYLCCDFTEAITLIKFYMQPILPRVRGC